MPNQVTFVYQNYQIFRNPETQVGFVTLYLMLCEKQWYSLGLHTAVLGLLDSLENTVMKYTQNTHNFVTSSVI